MHRSSIQPRDYPPRLQARVSFTQTFDSRKDKYRVATISFLPSSQSRPNPRHPSRSPYRSSSRQSHATSNGRRPRKSASFSKKRRLTPVRSSPSPTRQISPTHNSPPRRTRASPITLDVLSDTAALPTPHTTSPQILDAPTTSAPLPLATQPPPIPPLDIVAPHDDINSKTSQVVRSSMRIFDTYIGRVCFKNLLTCSTISSHVILRLVCEDIYH